MYSIPSTSTIRDPEALAIRKANGLTSSTERVDPPGSTCDARSNSSRDRGRRSLYRAWARSSADDSSIGMPAILADCTPLDVSVAARFAR